VRHRARHAGKELRREASATQGRRHPLRFALLAALLGLPLLAQAASAPLWSLTEENDGIGSVQDRHYTQGLRVARRFAPATQGFWSDLAADALDPVARALGAGPQKRLRIEWPIVGQSLFTPQNKESPTPDPQDRPYAGWLYVGAAALRQDAHDRTDRLQVLLGVVGPWALGQIAQNGFHAAFGYGKAYGWNDQLRNEPGLIASYQSIWDLHLLHTNLLEADLLPEAGITAGNVLTYGEVGAWARIGQGLAAGGTPETITPGLSGTGGLDLSALPDAVDWMIFGGIQTRAVWRNLFLEGNSYRSGPGVEKRNFVTDESVGISLLFRLGLRIDFTYTRRGREFSGQNYDDRFGSVTISAPL
jgi:Uncharacterized protein conserved in bacteria